MTIISSHSFQRWVRRNDRRRQKPSVLERYSFIKSTAFLHLLCLLRFIKFRTRSSELVLPCLRHLSGEWPPCFWWESEISAILHKKFINNKPEPVRSSSALGLIIRDVFEAVVAFLNDVYDTKLFLCKQRYAAAAGFHNGMRNETRVSGPTLEPPGGHAPSWSTALGSAVTIGHRWVCLALFGICLVAWSCNRRPGSWAWLKHHYRRIC